MNKIQCMFYEKQYTYKPIGSEIGMIQNSLKQTEIDIEDLALALSKGSTFKPALLSGTTSASFISQQLFALDFDEGTTIDKEFDRCVSLNISPCFAYTSFSHTEIKHKFRMVFCSNRIITNLNERNKIQAVLMTMFPTVDNKCNDASRLFFGGRQLIKADYECKFDADKLLVDFGIDNSVIKNAEKTDITKKGKQSNNNGYLNESYMLNIEAIKSLNVDVMQRVLGITNKEGFKTSFISCTENPSMMFKTEGDLYNYINHIDLGEFLGIGNATVRCVLPNHNDKTPSAHIFITDDKTPVYKCFGCGNVYTIITMVEALAKCKRREAIEFIKNIYNLELEKTEWESKQIDIMVKNANYLDSQEFKNKFPYLFKLIRTRKEHLQNMLMYFSEYVNENIQINGKPLFFASYNVLMDVCGINKNNRQTLTQSLTLFSLLNMLEKVEDDKIPEAELKKAISISAKYGFKKHTNFYLFSEYDFVQLEKSENIAKVLKENNISMKGISREYILRTFGSDKANKVYPQYKFVNKQGTSKKSNDRTIEIVNIIFEYIEKNGFCFESSITNNKNYEFQWKKSIQEILISYGLKKVRLNKELKEKFGIATKGYPFLIVEESMVQAA